MLSRRELVQRGLAAAALSGLPFSSILASSPALRLAVIVDWDLPDAAAITARHRGAAAILAAFRTDPGAIWINSIEPAIRSAPVALAGYTSAASLFCIQYLARDYGLLLHGYESGPVPFEAIRRARPELVDLRDPQFSGAQAGVSWVLSPRRG